MTENERHIEKLQAILYSLKLTTEGSDYRQEVVNAFDAAIAALEAQGKGKPPRPVPKKPGWWRRRNDSFPNGEEYVWCFGYGVPTLRCVQVGCLESLPVIDDGRWIAEVEPCKGDSARACNEG